MSLGAHVASLEHRKEDSLVSHATMGPSKPYPARVQWNPTTTDIGGLHCTRNTIERGALMLIGLGVKELRAERSDIIIM